MTTTTELENLTVAQLLLPLWGNKNPPSSYRAEFNRRMARAILGPPEAGAEFCRAVAREGERLNAERARKAKRTL